MQITLSNNEQVAGRDIYSAKIDGPILAIRIFFAMGTTRACVKTSCATYNIDWANYDQQKMFIEGINSETLFYDERQKPMFHEISSDEED